MPGASPFPLNLPVNNILTSNTTSSSNVSSRASLLPSSSSQKADEVRRKIHQTHLSYLSVEDSPEKLNLKEKLECLVFEFISIVPHSHKFSSIDVANCFNRSIVEKSDSYSPSDVALSFERLEKYASNLLRHPWRKEYLIIHTYSGYYRHYINNHIIGASQVLFAMGYREETNLPGHLVLDGPIDPDKLTKISLNCMIAMAEAQMVQMIGESLLNKGYDNISYDEIFSIRLRFTAGLEHSVKLICDPSIGKSSSIIDLPVTCASNVSKSPRVNQIELNNHAGLSSKSNTSSCLPLPSYESTNNQQASVWRDQMSPVIDNCHRASKDDERINRSNTSSISPGANYIPPPALFANVTASNNGNMPNLMNISSVNSNVNGYNVKSSKNRFTNSSRVGADSAGADVVDSIMSSLVNRQLNIIPTVPTVGNHQRIIPRSESDSSELRTIYRSDQSPYTNGHHSPSPPYTHSSKSYNHSAYSKMCDLNQQQQQQSQPQQQPQQQQQQQWNQPRIQYASTNLLTPNKSNTPYTTCLPDSRNISSVPPNHRKLSGRIDNNASSSASRSQGPLASIDNYSSSTPSNIELNRYPNYDSQINCAKFPFSSHLESNHHKTQQYLPINSNSSSQSLDQFIQPLGTLRTSTCANVNTRKPPPPPPPSSNQLRLQQPLPQQNHTQQSLSSHLSWSCKSCTFLNQAQSDVCEMCSRSREKKMDSNSLVSGGKECSQCTLVNSRDVENCRACGSDLLNSPTYI